MSSGHTAEQQTLLVADDQRDVREALRLLLADQGYKVLLADSPQAVVDSVKKGGVSLALLDLNYTRDTTSGKEGLDLLQSLHEIDPGLPTVAMTAWGSVDLVVSAMQSGACDFIEKPWDNTRLLTVVRTHLERCAATRGAQRLREIAQIQSEDRIGGEVVAESSGMRRVLELARQVAPSDASVLLTGENGTGKNLVAELIHRWSTRSDEPFISVNMGSIPEALFESEMFGHVKGAFTDARDSRSGRFELADGGTLFLDEVGNTPLAQQAKLLRVLESGSFERVGGSRTRTANVRVLTATNADLQTMIDDGNFRRDLFFRLNTVEIHIPSLRERAEDIPALATRFLDQQCQRHGRKLSFSPNATTALRSHQWPGNVRELSHCVERAVLLSSGDEIQAGDLALSSRNEAQPGDGQVMKLEDAERLLIRNAIERFDGNVQEAAQALGLSRSAMYRRLEKLGLSAEGG
ncbi:MAG TPA: sigma-54 dependent transcriptional regulator [Xanthomonadales bacterium]|nr:sigma-54 dependent transcriptional regulator [Xanthomonadales bacterium]